MRASLRDFVSTTLVQILQGVQDAQLELSKPLAGRKPSGVVVPYRDMRNESHYQEVAFSVAVAPEIDGTDGRGWHLEVGGLFGVGRTPADTPTANRIDFRVPIQFLELQT